MTPTTHKNQMADYNPCVDYDDLITRTDTFFAIRVS